MSKTALNAGASGSGIQPISMPGPSNSSSSNDAAPEYRYLQEISQMMFVFADVTDPHTDVLKLIEDIVRNQVIEMIIQSRRLAQRRGSRFLSPEDLIFLIRYDRGKVNRLRTYLSWKDVRKNAKESAGDGGAGGGPEAGAEGVEDNVDAPLAKTRKAKIRLPWEISTMFSEHLSSSASVLSKDGQNRDDDDEPDDDELEAHEDSIQRLRDADEATRKMTREEYVHYSECRQASFTFRKGKRFRDFINAGAYLDVKPNDDIIDILGFLAFEVVRELCVGAVGIKRRLEEEEREARRRRKDEQRRRDVSEVGGKGQMIGTGRGRDRRGTLLGGKQGGEDELQGSGARKRKASLAGGERSSPSKRAVPPTGSFGGAAPTARRPLDSSGLTDPEASSSEDEKAVGVGEEDESPSSSDDEGEKEACTLFTMPKPRSSPLTPAHIHESFARLQRGRSHLVSGMGGAPGGLRRTRVFVI